MTSIFRDFPATAMGSKLRPIVGDTKISVVGIDHSGWLVCDGRLMNVSEFTSLFNVVGYQFGGSGNQFALPNPAGRVPGIAGSGPGLTSRAIGSNVGAETHVLSSNEMPVHTHGINDPGHTHSYFNQPNGLNANQNAPTTDFADNINVNQTTGSSVTNITVTNAGGGLAHNNMQPTLFVGNMFIYSGKVTYGAAPYTTGIYATPALTTAALYSNVQ